MLEPGGAFVRMEIEPRDIQSKKAGDGVSAGTYPSNDEAARGMWAVTIDKRDLVKYFVDA